MLDDTTAAPRLPVTDSSTNRALAFFTSQVMTEVEAWLQNPADEAKAILAAAALYQVTDHYWQSLPRDDIRRHRARNVREFRSHLDRLCNAFAVIRDVVENRGTFILRRPNTPIGVVVQANRRRSGKSQHQEELIVCLDGGIERQFSGVIREAVETWQALLTACP